jgi:hypothetical protein
MPIAIQSKISQEDSVPIPPPEDKNTKADSNNERSQDAWYHEKNVSRSYVIHLLPPKASFYAPDGPAASYKCPVLLNTVPKPLCISAWNGSNGMLSPSMLIYPLFWFLGMIL